MEPIKFKCSCGKTVLEMVPGSSISVDTSKDGLLNFTPKKLEATIQLAKECTTFTFDQLIEAYNAGIKAAKDTPNPAIEKAEYWKLKHHDLINKLRSWVIRKTMANEDGSGHTPDPSFSELENLTKED